MACVTYVSSQSLIHHCKILCDDKHALTLSIKKHLLTLIDLKLSLGNIVV